VEQLTNSRQTWHMERDHHIVAQVDRKDLYLYIFCFKILYKHVKGIPRSFTQSQNNSQVFEAFSESLVKSESSRAPAKITKRSKSSRHESVTRPTTSLKSCLKNCLHMRFLRPFLCPFPRPRLRRYIC
jgi:hypothetical protein